MPGIFGIANHRQDIQLDHVIHSMLKSMDRGNRFKTAVHIGDQFAFGSIKLKTDLSDEEKVAVSRDGRYSCIVYGNLYDCGQYNKHIKDPVSLLSPAHAIVEIYSKFNEKIFPELRGEFTVAIFDSQENTLTIANDQLGMMPLYYLLSDKCLFFASEVKALLPCKKDLLINYTAITDFLLFGYLLGEDTFFNDISLLAPATILNYSLITGFLEKKKYWQLEQWLEDIDTSKDDHTVLNQLNHVFKRAVKQRFADREMSISLSGGLDSRVILAVASNLGKVFTCITSGFGNCIDKRVTEKLADLVSSKYFYEDYINKNVIQRMPEFAQQVVEITDGMRGSQFSALTILGGERGSNHQLSHIIYGHGGELAKLNQAYGFAISKNEKLPDKDNISDLLYRKARLSYWKNIDTNSFIMNRKLKDAMNDAPNRFNRILSRINTELPFEQIVSYYFLNEYFRKFSVLSFGVHRDYNNVHLPFIDIDFVKSLLHTPPQMRRSTKIHQFIIEQNCSCLKNVPVSQTRVRINPSIIEKLFVNIPYRVLCKMGFFKWDKPEDLIASQTDGYEYSLILLDKRTSARGLVSTEIISDILTKFKTDKSHLPFLARLYQMELWFRKFVD